MTGPDQHTEIPDYAEPCNAAPCTTHHHGHQIHWIQAKRAGQLAWGWRDAVVVRFDGEGAQLSYVLDDGQPRIWSHRSLPTILAVGDPVRLHEQCKVLDTGRSGWISIAIANGLGAVPEPDATQLWGAETTVPVVNLATGIAYTEVPHPPTEEEDADD